MSKCALPLPELQPRVVPCNAPGTCAVCGYCTTHCLQHFRINDGIANGRTVDLRLNTGPGGNE